jgi:hypothetical protein
MWRHVDLVWTDVLEAALCSHLLTLVPRSRIFLPWRWRWYDPLKHQFTQDLHGATSLKMAFFIVTAVKTSNLTFLNFLFILLSYLVEWEETSIFGTKLMENAGHFKINIFVYTPYQDNVQIQTFSFIPIAWVWPWRWGTVHSEMLVFTYQVINQCHNPVDYNMNPAWIFTTASILHFSHIFLKQLVCMKYAGKKQIFIIFFMRCKMGIKHRKYHPWVWTSHFHFSGCCQ